MSADLTPIPSIDVVVFEIDERRFAIGSEQVRELLRAVAVVPLPGAPVGVDGVIDVRGTVVPLFDLRARLGLRASAVRATEQYVVCDAGVLGVIAVRSDRIVEIRRMTELAALPPGSPQDGMARALVRTPDGVVVLFDLAAVLTEHDAEQLACAMTAQDATPS